MTDNDPAVEAAALAVQTEIPYVEVDPRVYAVAVAAARPIIEAEVRAKIAAEERAVQHYRTGPARCACGYDAYVVGAGRFFPDYHAMFMQHLDDVARSSRSEA